MLERLRGGSTDFEIDKDLEKKSNDDSTDDIPSHTAKVVVKEGGESGEDKLAKTDDNEEGESVSPKSAFGEPVSVTIKTATGSKLLDQSIELMTVNRNRNVASLKQTVSRQLPAKPPVTAIQLTLHGKILADDTLVDDLIDDDEDEESTEGLVLQLDMIPTVDPKFFSELEQKIPELTVSELLDAYSINEAAVYQNAALLLKEAVDDTEDDEDMEKDVAVEKRQRPTVLVNTQIREQAARIRKDLETTILRTDQAQALLAETQPPCVQRQLASVEVKGQRVRRVGISGVRGSWKRVIQHNLNVDWTVTIRHFLLFLFFGWFGGRTASSRAILLLGAPSVFVLQARPVKLLLRQALYTLLDHPPGILLSLLPAPQQAILSLDCVAAMDTIYGKHIVSSTPSQQMDGVEGEADDLPGATNNEEDFDSDFENEDVDGSDYDDEGDED